MKKKQINIGIIGGGINSTIGKAHISALRMDGNFNIVAGFFSKTIKSNLKTIETYKLNNLALYDDINKYIENENYHIDVFLILTDTPSHFNIIKKLINLNKIIICEKPSCNNLENLLYLRKKIKMYKTKFYPFYNYLGYPILTDIKKILDKNKIGKIKNIDISMSQQGLTQNKINKIKKWRLLDESLPTIQLDLGVHVFSILNVICNLSDVRKLISLEQSSDKKKLVHTVDSWIRFKNRTVCKLSVSKYKIGHRNDLNINVYGEKGSLFWKHQHPEILEYNNFKGKKFILDRNDIELTFSNLPENNRYTVGHPYGFIESMANYYHKIYNSILGKKNNNGIKPITINDEIKIFNLISKSHKSSSTNKWINF